MSDESFSTRSKQDIGHEIGEHNIQVMGLDIHNPVFAISAALVLALLTGTLLYPELAAEVFVELRSWITSKFDWFFLLAVNIFTVFLMRIAFSRLERIFLGGQDAVFLIRPGCVAVIRTGQGQPREQQRILSGHLVAGSRRRLPGLLQGRRAAPLEKEPVRGQVQDSAAGRLCLDHGFAGIRASQQQSVWPREGVLCPGCVFPGGDDLFRLADRRRQSSELQRLEEAGQ